MDSPCTGDWAVLGLSICGLSRPVPNSLAISAKGSWVCEANGRLSRGARHCCNRSIDGQVLMSLGVAYHQWVGHLKSVEFFGEPK